MIDLACKLYLRDQGRADWKLIGDKFRLELKQKVAKRFEKGRTALAHGVGEEDSLMHAITEVGWEGTIALDGMPSLFLDWMNENYFPKRLVP